MELETLKTLGQIAGIGGIALGVLLLVLKSIIQKKIFSNFSPEQSYKIFRLIIVIVFFIAVLGVVSWVYISDVKEGSGKSIFFSGNKITVLGKVVDSLSKPIKNAKVEIEEFPGIFNLTDDNGLYVLEIRGNDQQFVEFKVTHNYYVPLTNKVRIDFNDQPPEVNNPKFVMKIETPSERKKANNLAGNSSSTKENFNNAGDENFQTSDNLTNVTVIYLGDSFNCTLDLKIKIGDKTGRLTSSSTVIKGVPKGLVNYNITGEISCTIGICSVTGSNSLEISDDVQLYLIWSNTGYAVCEAYLSEEMLL